MKKIIKKTKKTVQEEEGEDEPGNESGATPTNAKTVRKSNDNSGAADETMSRNHDGSVYAKTLGHTYISPGKYIKPKELPKIKKLA